jgi:hypothetical protein
MARIIYFRSTPGGYLAGIGSTSDIDKALICGQTIPLASNFRFILRKQSKVLFNQYLIFYQDISSN